ncbi:RNA polymerase subunit sigma-70 [Clostridium tetani]|nr:RNA polymerase subunit sigma-70 [Clostridium tetani]RXM72686.1 RNA polymerase subunit sigma-70 [Clostridium tetani]
MRTKISLSEYYNNKHYLEGLKVYMFDSIINILGSNILLTAYVTGNNSFPKPLKAEEEKYYLKQLEKGDISAKGVLIERNLRLVAHIVKKYSFPGKDMDDLISIGTIGLIKAIDSFKIDRGTRLATYAAKCIENEILMLIRNNKKTKGEVYLQDPIGIDKEGNELPWTSYQSRV